MSAATIVKHSEEFNLISLEKPPETVTLTKASGVGVPSFYLSALLQEHLNLTC